MPRLPEAFEPARWLEKPSTAPVGIAPLLVEAAHRLRGLTLFAVAGGWQASCTMGDANSWTIAKAYSPIDAINACLKQRLSYDIQTIGGKNGS